MKENMIGMAEATIRKKKKAIEAIEILEGDLQNNSDFEAHVSALALPPLLVIMTERVKAAMLDALYVKLNEAEAYLESLGVEPGHRGLVKRRRG